MALNGARASTFDAMRSALQLGAASQADVNAGYRSLIALLRSLDGAVDLRIANSIWYRNDMTFSGAFIDAGKTNFDAVVQGLDFSKSAASAAVINKWVSDQTNAKIPSIIDTIDPADVMFLINAIYFKGTWRSRFDPADTKPGDFTAASGAKQPAQFMMRHDDKILYATADGAQAVDLPYGNAAFTMTVILPPPGVSADQYAAIFTADRLKSLTDRMFEHAGTLWMPKLKLSYERTLNDDLTALGMGVAFTDLADFSGMAGSPGLLALSYVKQKTYVDVNEEGTEAAAVTVTGVGLTSAPVRIELRVDRPYLFIIRDHLSGTILFIGKVNAIP
jgi:serine protease inhibitor